MTKTPLNHIPDEFPDELPDELRSHISNAKIYDSSSSPEARVFFIDKERGYFLKRSSAGALSSEAAMTGYFNSIGLAPEVLFYSTSDSYDWLLTENLFGEDLTGALYLENPKRLCDTIATRLRSLHETDFSGCPIADRMTDYFALADENYRCGLFTPSLFTDSDYKIRTADEAWKISTEGRKLLDGRVLLHGDYCLPNIIYDRWNFSGFIDLGGGGVGDRHIDIFWGAWTLNFNLKTDRYRERFLDCYGRDMISADALRTVAATELFG